MILKTGFGYYVKDGKKVSKFELTPGYHPDPKEGYSVVEVNSQEELDGIVLEKSNEQLDREKAREGRKMLANNAREKIKKIVGLTDDEINALLGN